MKVICASCGYNATEEYRNGTIAAELRKDIEAGKESVEEFGELLSYLEAQDPNGVHTIAFGPCPKCDRTELEASA